MLQLRKTKIALSFIPVLLPVTFETDTISAKMLAVNMGKKFVLILPHILAD